MIQDTHGSWTHKDDPGEPIYGTPRISVTDEEGRLLAELVKGKTVLEIGTGLGMSTRAMATTAAKVTTIDIDPWVRNTIWPGLAEIHNINCAEKLSNALKVDVVFIDACHYTNQIDKDVELARKHLKHGGRIIFHDALWIPKGAYGEMEMHLTTYGIGVVEVE